MNAEDRRAQRLQLQEDEIGRAIARSEAAGELRLAPSWGKPLAFGDGYDQTPAELRLSFKILKDAGIVPPEVELMQQIAALQAQVDGAAQGTDVQPLRQRVAEMRQLLALRLQKLRISGTL